MNDLFLGREQRKAAIAPERMRQLQELGRLSPNVINQSFVEESLDRELSTEWLASKMGLGRERVAANFDAFSEAYFGRKVTPSQAYDHIAQREAQNAMAFKSAAPAGQAEPIAETAEPSQAKDWQFFRAATSSFNEMAQRIPAGLFGINRGLAETISPAPERKKLSDDEAWNNAAYELARLEVIGGDQEQVAALRATMRERSKTIDAEHRAALADYEKTWLGREATISKENAQFWHELANEADQRWEVDPEFRETAVGQAAGLIGSLPATSALAALGPVGWGGMLAQQYGVNEAERMEIEGEGYKAGGRNFFVSLGKAGANVAIEKAFKFDDILASALKETASRGGKIAARDYLRQVGRAMLITGASEGAEEVLQQISDDVADKFAYDNGLSFVDAAAAKRYGVAFVAGVAGGAIMGGTVRGLQLADNHLAARRASRLLTTKDGDLMGPEDFRILSEARTAEEIKAMPFGEVLARAATGDVAAQQEYNQEVMRSRFTKTEGQSIEGVQLGTIDGKPAFIEPNGRTTVVDMKDPESAARWRALQSLVAASIANEAGEVAVNDLISRFRQQVPGIEISYQASRTLADEVKDGRVSMESALDALRIANEAQGVQMTLEEAKIAGTGTAILDAAGVVKEVIALTKANDPITLIEEKAHAGLEALIKSGKVEIGQITQMRHEWNGQNGIEARDESAWTESNLKRVNHEWFAARVIEYAIANQADLQMPRSFTGYLRKFARQVRAIVQGAIRMKRAMRDGKLNPALEAVMREVIAGGQSVQIDKAHSDYLESIGRFYDVMEAEIAKGNAVEDANAQEAAELSQIGIDLPRIVTTKDGAYSVVKGNGEEVGKFESIEDAKKSAQKYAERQVNRIMRDFAKSEIQEEPKLLSAVVKSGGIPTKDDVFQGELDMLRESMGKGAALRYFRKDALSLDYLRESVNENGFAFDTINDLLVALDEAARPTAGSDTLFSLTPAQQAALKATLDALHHSMLMSRGFQQLAEQQARTYSKNVTASKIAAQKIASGGAESWFNRNFQPLDFAVGRIAPELKSRMRLRSFEEAAAVTADFRGAIEPFGRKFAKLPESVQLDFWMRTRRGERDNVHKLAKALDFEPELNAMEAMFDSIRLAALEAGIPPGKFWIAPDNFNYQDPAYRSDIEAAKARGVGAAGAAIESVLAKYGWRRSVEYYWPSKVFDRDGLDKYLGGVGVETDVAKAYRQLQQQAAARGFPITEEEFDSLAEIAAKMGFAQKGSSAPSALKGRKIAAADVDAGLGAFYYNALEAASMHSQEMRGHIATARMFGKAIVYADTMENLGSVFPVDAGDSVGRFIADAVAVGSLSRSDEEQLKTLLRGRYFEKARTPDWVRSMISLGHLQGLTQIYSPLTMTLPDMVMGSYEANGNLPRLLKNIGKAIGKKSNVTLEDLGIDARYLDEEFRVNSQGSIAKAVSFLFRYGGANYLNRIIREGNINAALETAGREARKGQLGTIKQRRLEAIFGDRSAAVMADLAAGKKNKDTLLFAWATLAEYSPISKDQTTYFATTSPFGKVFGTFKSFLWVQMAATRTIAIDDMFSGDARRATAGFGRLASWVALMLICGLPADLIRAWVTGSSFVLTDAAVARLMGLVGLSPYITREMGRNADIKQAVGQFFIPSVADPVAGLYEDAQALLYFDYSAAEFDYGKLNVWANIPIAGRWWSGRFGARAEKNQKIIEEKGGQFVLVSPEAEAGADDEAEASKRKRLTKKYAKQSAE